MWWATRWELREEAPVRPLSRPCRVERDIGGGRLCQRQGLRNEWRSPGEGVRSCGGSDRPVIATTRLTVIVVGCRRSSGTGFDAAKMAWTDLMGAGIIDPAKVTRSALQNASSIAGLLLTTEATITDLPEKEKPAAPGGGGGEMGGMPPY